MPPQLPNFVVVGAMKAGTSTVATLVDEHPQGYVVPNKEVYFFDRDDVHARGIDWYRGKFAGASGQRAVGEASPSYMFWPAAIDRMAAVIPDAKLIAVLRDPVSRAYSQYGHERFYARERRTFAVAIDDELSGGTDAGKPFWYVDRGRYLPQLLRVCERFDRSRLLVLLSDDLRDAAEETAARLFRFLEIDESVRPSGVGGVVNPYRENRFPRAWRFMMKHRIWRRLGPLREPTLKVFIRTNVKQAPMDPAVRDRLRAAFAEDNAALSEWLGRGLTAWSGEPSRSGG